MHFVALGIVIAAAVVIAETSVLTMVSMAAMYDHFVAVNQTINYCSSVVVEANRILCFHRDQLITDETRWSQCAHPINMVNLFKFDSRFMPSTMEWTSSGLKREILTLTNGTNT